MRRFPEGGSIMIPEPVPFLKGISVKDAGFPQYAMEGKTAINIAER